MMGARQFNVKLFNPRDVVWVTFEISESDWTFATLFKKIQEFHPTFNGTITAKGNFHFLVLVSDIGSVKVAKLSGLTIRRIIRACFMVINLIVYL